MKYLFLFAIFITASIGLHAETELAEATPTGFVYFQQSQNGQLSHCFVRASEIDSLSFDPLDDGDEKPTIWIHTKTGAEPYRSEFKTVQKAIEAMKRILESIDQAEQE